MATPAPPGPPIPHVGGPIQPPGAVTVAIGGAPAAKVGDLCLCTPPAPPDAIVAGSSSVTVMGLPAARVSDATAHGGQVTVGCPNVLIGG